MGILALKSNIHRIVDEIQDESLLRAIYDFLKMKEENSEGRLWESLTPTEKDELLSAYRESEDEKNLLNRDAFFKRKG